MNIRISNKTVGEKTPTFVIAEAGINHNGRLKTAKQLILKAKSSGADAIKFQTFKASDLASKKSPFFKILKKLELEYDGFSELADYSKSNNLIFLSTPFSFEAVDLLTKLKVPAFKIASGDLTHLPLIKYAAQKKKPIIISTGMATLGEVKESVKAIESMKNRKIVIMHSVSGYPTPENEVNLSVIDLLKKIFPYPVGFSDNGSSDLVPLVAVSLGAKIIEKHFTLNRKMKGPDHQISADPKQFKEMTVKIRKIEQMFGDGKKICQPSEIKNRIATRRSITAKLTIKKNTRITKEMMDIKRPAKGIEPKFFSSIIGRKTRRILKSNESISWNDLR